MISGSLPEAPAIRFTGVGKRYWKLDQRPMLLRSLLPVGRPTRTELWALRDLDLTVERGETLGIIGRNGAGKTTLLRLLAGVTQPSRGRAQIRGRVAPLISVGVGFHQEMSGRENIFVNGMLLGLRRAEVEERFHDIVAFAELADFIDTPVKFYSSGMFMRLGFSVAIHVEPQVLLLDEILAVGDLAFQLKCFDRMRAIQRSGTTIVMVSHSLHAIRLLCPRVAVIRQGRLVFDGEAEAAIAVHHQLLSADAAARVSEPSEPGTGRARGRPSLEGDPDAVRLEPGRVRVLERALIGPDGPAHAAVRGEALVLRMRLRFEAEVDSPQVRFDVVAEDGTLAYQMLSAVGKPYRHFRAGEETEVQVSFEARLAGGTYRVTTAVTSLDGRAVFDHDPVGLLISLAPRPGSTGIADLGASIAVDGHSILTDGPIALGGASGAQGRPPAEAQGRARSTARQNPGPSTVPKR